MSTLVHVYRLASKPTEALPEALLASLPEDERRRILPLRRPQDRRNRALAYAAAFRLLHKHSGVATAHIHLVRNQWGKPEPVLPDGVPRLHMSLSHSAECVLVAIASCAIGVDVEAIRPVNMAAINRQMFPGDTGSADTPLAFHAVWTAREAVLKALGTGLSIEPSTLALGQPTPDFQALASHPPGLGLEDARVAKLDMPEGYAGAVAAMHTAPRYILQHLGSADLHALATC